MTPENGIKQGTRWKRINGVGRKSEQTSLAMALSLTDGN
jgi:hypothetical protein